MPLHGVYNFALKSSQLDHRGRMPVWVIYHFLQEAAEHNAVEIFASVFPAHRGILQLPPAPGCCWTSTKCAP